MADGTRKDRNQKHLFDVGETAVKVVLTQSPWELKVEALTIPVGNNSNRPTRVGTFGESLSQALGREAATLERVLEQASAKRRGGVTPNQPVAVDVRDSAIAIYSLRTIFAATAFRGDGKAAVAAAARATVAVADLASTLGVRSVAIPFLGTGAGGLDFGEVAHAVSLALRDGGPYQGLELLLLVTNDSRRFIEADFKGRRVGSYYDRQLPGRTLIEGLLTRRLVISHAEPIDLRASLAALDGGPSEWGVAQPLKAGDLILVNVRRTLVEKAPDYGAPPGYRYLLEVGGLTKDAPPNMPWRYQAPISRHLSLDHPVATRELKREPILERWRLDEGRVTQLPEGLTTPLSGEVAAAFWRVIFKSNPSVADDIAGWLKDRGPTTFMSPEFPAFDDDQHVGVDQLGFEQYVIDFAKLICARSVSPPLSIGLFGGWGTGKSFFMRKLEETAKKIVGSSENKEAPYCDRLAHIWFNAWHYEDTDLWASLATHTYDCLALELSEASKKEGSEGLEELEEIKRRLHCDIDSSQQALAEATRRQTAAVEKRKAAVESLQNRQDERGKASWQLATFKVSSTLDELGTLAAEFGLPVAKETLDDIETLQADLQVLRERSHTILPVLKGFSSSRGRVFVSVGFFTFLIVVTLIWGPALGRIVEGALGSESFGWLNDVAVQIASLVVVVVPWVVNRVGKLNKALGHAQRIREVAEKVFERPTIVSGNKEVSDLQERILDLGSQIEKSIEEVAVAERRMAVAQEEIQRIGAGGLVYDFVESRGSDEAYSSQLGLISTIRKDFGKLRDLLRNWNKHNGKEGLTEPLAAKGAFEGRAIDRIVLYIDDLDRCHPSRVVEVLQAVHLLMAFDLFVVVVGVDPRWLQRSLYKTYVTDLDGYYRRNDIEKSLEPFQPDNYLEKIFQIPFVVPQMEASGFGALVRNLAGSDVSDAVENVTAGEIPLDPDSSPQGEKSSKESADKSLDEPPLGRSMIEEETEVQALSALTLTEEEVHMLEKVGVFVRTPRLAKRFINIYRLIRIHVAQKQDAFDDLVRVGGSHRYVIPLLAIRVGYPRVAEIVFAHVLAADADGAELGDHLELLVRPGTLPSLFNAVPSSEVSDVRLLAQSWLELQRADLPSDVAGHVPWIGLTARFSFGRSDRALD